VAAVASPLDLTELVAAIDAVALLLRLIKFPASWMFGAMIGSSVLHGAGWVEGAACRHRWRGVALVGIGALIGSRFARMKARPCSAMSMPRWGHSPSAIVFSAVFGRGDRADHPCAGQPTSSSRSRRGRWTPCWRWR